MPGAPTVELDPRQQPVPNDESVILFGLQSGQGVRVQATAEHAGLDEGDGRLDARLQVIDQCVARPRQPCSPSGSAATSAQAARPSVRPHRVTTPSRRLIDSEPIGNSTTESSSMCEGSTLQPSPTETSILIVSS